MTEEEKLKKETEKQFVKQRLDELQAYIDSLFKKLEVSYQKRRRHAGFMLAIMITFFIATLARLFIPGTLTIVASMAASFLLWFGILREMVIHLPYEFGIISELDGCFNTLEILGLLEKRDEGNARVKKYKESLMAKMWQALKAKKMRDAFA